MKTYQHNLFFAFVFTQKSNYMFLGSRTAAFELSDPQRPTTMAAAVSQRPVLMAEQPASWQVGKAPRGRGGVPGEYV